MHLKMHDNTMVNFALPEENETILASNYKLYLGACPRIEIYCEKVEIGQFFT